ncbi:hypothetical protein HYH03_017164 [Edaphochlamys debaryana]|uniref:Translation initiation factor eIF2B subunit delta n=1 Tax=Edaphochlamys debaryana TaxID=47281 RepID=A0A835XIX7_9CHLO|nr:hypothetical protein HYH03_017164 [Edaphochlamys debaryana]|eukprot:KAG2483997.1 hypothetical protein HYH03_017164 [Edaphochlamys debaryana]
MTGGQQKPVKQVVGFHVEGASPSPPGLSLLQNEMTAGSPTPVIIPPTFQRETSHGARSSTLETAARAVVDPGAVSTSAQPQPVPAAPAEACPSVAASAPRPIHQAERAEASHAGMAQAAVGSQSSLASESAMSSASAGMFSLDTSTRNPQSPAPHHPQHHHHHQHSPFAAASGAPAPGAAASAPAGKAPKAASAAAAAPAAAAGGDGAPKGPKPQREMTKAERRALQESQRAAKAAQKAGGDGVAEKPPRGPAAAVRAEGADGGRGSRGGGSSVEPRPASAARPPSSVAGGPSDRRIDSLGGAGGAGGPGSVVGIPPASAGGGAGGAGGEALRKKKDPKAVSLNSTELFAHLQQYKRVTAASLLQLGQPGLAGVHPAVLQLGLRYADGSIRGANARCLAMLHTFCQVIRDYTTPEGKELSRDLLRHLGDQVNFLVVCRPLSVGMGNAIRHLKLRISTIPPETPEGEAKELLEQEIADYINVRIDSADKQLVAYAVAKVEAHGDVILTYAASHVVIRALVEAAQQGKSFRVVVADSRPETEGRATLARLMAAGIPCTYIHMNALSYIIREVTKVFLGAAAVLSNGTVLSRAGTAAVAMMAHAHSKPVMICCETHKFNERVQLDSITHNELGDPQALAAVPGKPEINALEGWAENPRLRLLNLKYDVMPAEYVTMVVTEFGMVPPTSVPVILREFRQSEQTVSGPF